MICRFALGLAACLWAGGAMAADDPEAAMRPLRELMAISTSVLGQESLCTDATRPDQTVRLGEILARAFAYQTSGRNTTAGRCGKRGQCEIFIRHAEGEDVWERHITFRSAGGKADPKTVRCLDTG